MKFKWNLKKIDSIISDCSIDRKNIYRQMVDDLQSNVDNYKDNIYVDVLSFFEALDKFDLSFFDTSFFKIVSTVSKYIKKYNFEYSEVEKIDYEPKNVVTFAKEYYRKYDRNNYTYFKSVISYNNHIHFTGNINANFNGRSYILNKKEFYVLINSTNYIQDIITFIHECKHIENSFKNYDETIYYYQELPSILSSFYVFDYLKSKETNDDSIKKVYNNFITKYCTNILKMERSIKLIKIIKNSDNFHYLIKNNFEILAKQLDFNYLYNMLNINFVNKEMSNVISFLLSIYIYSNFEFKTIDNVMVFYMFGLEKIKPEMLDSVINYLENYNKDNLKTKKVKKIVDKH